MKETIFELLLSTREDSSCFFTWSFVDVYAGSLLISSGLFSLLPGRWCTYECLRLLVAQMSIVLEYYTHFVISRWAAEVIFCIAVSKFSVRAHVSSLLTAHFGVHVGFSSDCTGVKKVSASEYFFLYLRAYIILYNLSAFSSLLRSILLSSWSPVLPIIGSLWSTSLPKSTSACFFIKLQPDRLVLYLLALFATRSGLLMGPSLLVRSWRLLWGFGKLCWSWCPKHVALLGQLVFIWMIFLL